MIAERLGMGKVMMEEGVTHCGFIAEAIAMDGADDILELGGWRGYAGGA